MRNEWNKQRIPLFTQNVNYRQQKPDLSAACNVQLQRADFFAPKSMTVMFKSLLKRALISQIISFDYIILRVARGTQCILDLTSQYNFAACRKVRTNNRK